MHQVYDILVRFPSNHIFIHRNELISRSKASISLGGSVLYDSANNNLFKDNDVSSGDEGEEDEDHTVTDLSRREACSSAMLILSHFYHTVYSKNTAKALSMFSNSVWEVLTVCVCV